MAIPKTIDEFLVEVTQQTVKGTRSVQDTLYHCLDRSADTNRAFLAVLEAVQRAGLHATFHFQNVVIQSSQAVLDVTLQVSTGRGHRRLGQRRLWPEATLKITRRGGSLIPAIDQPAPSPEAESSRAGGWADSALHFQSPLGMISSEHIEEDDDP